MSPGPDFKISDVRKTIRILGVSLALIALLVFATGVVSDWNHHDSTSDARCPYCHLGHQAPNQLEAPLCVAVLKPVASAIAIGTGGPFGAEGPIIMTGGALGSLVAQALSMSASERKTLLAAGAAAGMAAIFFTPVAAVVLAIELLLFEWKPRSFIPVAAAAAVAALLRVPLLGPGPLFPLAAHAALGWGGLVVCLLVGVLTGGVAVALVEPALAQVVPRLR